ncbi:unnamed protein product [Ectocarpus sp. 12 AP-2014]
MNSLKRLGCTSHPNPQRAKHAPDSCRALTCERAFCGLLPPRQELSTLLPNRNRRPLHPVSSSKTKKLDESLRFAYPPPVPTSTDCSLGGALRFQCNTAAHRQREREKVATCTCSSVYQTWGHAFISDSQRR